MTVKLVPLALAVAVAGSAQAPVGMAREGAYWVRTTQGTVDAARVRELRVATWGDIALRGAPGGSISYSLETRVRANSESEAARLMDGLRARTGRDGSILQLTMDCCAQRRTFATLTVTAPSRIEKAYLKTLGGNVLAEHLPATVIVESGGGRIEADRIGGGFHAKTVGGEIRLGVVDGPVKCISGAGGIRARQIGGEARLETAGGEIHVDEAADHLYASSGGGNIHIGVAAKGVNARTAGGIIEVEQSGGMVIAETAGGGISVMNSPGAKCQSNGGPIRLNGVEGTLRAATAAGDIVAVLMSGAALEDSFLDTSHGDVTVYIPSNMAVTVKARNTPAGQAGRIVSDFPEIPVARGGKAGFGPAMAEGALNGGGPLLTVSAAGSIFLRRK